MARFTPARRARAVVSRHIGGQVRIATQRREVAAENRRQVEKAQRREAQAALAGDGMDMSAKLVELFRAGDEVDWSDPWGERQVISMSPALIGIFRGEDDETLEDKLEADRFDELHQLLDPGGPTLEELSDDLARVEDENAATVGAPSPDDEYEPFDREEDGIDPDEGFDPYEGRYTDDV